MKEPVNAQAQAGKKRIGRPPAENPLQVMSFRATKAEAKLIADAASAAGMKRTLWMRRRLLLGVKLQAIKTKFEASGGWRG